MPEQPVDVQRINWSSCFAFTQIFRTFKMTLHPSKLGLALAAILLVGLWGSLLDGIWSSKCQPLTGEAAAFWRTPDIGQWRRQMIDERAGMITATYLQAGLPAPGDDLKKNPSAALSHLKDQYRSRISSKSAKAEDVTQIAARFNDAYRLIERLENRGVFHEFLTFETSTIRQFIDAAASLNFTGGMHQVMTARRPASAAPDLAGILKAQDDKLGALPNLILMARGMQWLMLVHPWYALLFLLGQLAIWSVLGGAICRMAALNFARDERIPVKAALDFARRKFVGFFTAPLLPAAIVLGLGALLAVGGLIGSIPYIGGLLTGLFLILALAAGFVMALVLIGFLAGGSLMWPTIAVEGSDSFDAMSRSYSYVYSRPWKAALYAVVASVYGAICYLFVRWFVWLMMWVSRFFLGHGMCWTSRPGTGSPGGTRIDALWPIPTLDELLRSPPPFAAAYDDGVGRWLAAIWLGLTAMLLCAFLATFYFCGSTVMYYLLRREVDATDLEDVYSEEDEEEEVAGAAPAVDTTTGPAADAPPTGA